MDEDKTSNAGSVAAATSNTERRGKKRSQAVSTSEESMEVDRPSSKVIRAEVRKISVPPHRYTPLKQNWMKIFTPIVENLGLQVRFNTKSRHVEIRAGNDPALENTGYLQKAEDFVKAFLFGFEVDDALALVRLEDLFIESFDVQDVKTVKGDHLSRAVGRLAGKGGRTKFTIENSTKTRIVLADTKVHILGAYQNIQMARRAICNLILGTPASKVHGTLRNMASRASERF